ncbi:MAG TPA: hypothetical protein VHE53_02795 [Patescibacteria group bacterium]|nr:hypothetical protein [Patescibacteria group bacterium]
MKNVKSKLTNFLKNVVRIRAKNKILILSSIGGKNTYGYEIGKAIFEICDDMGCKVNLIMQTPRLFSKPMDNILQKAMIEDYDIVFQTDVDKLGHDPIGAAKPYFVGENRYTNILYYRKAKKEITAFWFYVSDIDKWLDSIDVDYQEMGNISLILENKIKKTKYISFLSNNGKNQLKLKVNKDNFPKSDYSFRPYNKGEGGNIPFGETLMTPDNSFTEGSLVVDASFYNEIEEKTVTIKTPIILSFKDGRLFNIKGEKEANILRGMLAKIKRQTITRSRNNPNITQEYIDNIYRIGEFAIGTNKKATICGDILIDEKVYGTAHIALGRSYDGDPAFIHCDLVVRKPTIIFEYNSGESEIIVNNNKIMPEK